MWSKLFNQVEKWTDSYDQSLQNIQIEMNLDIFIII